jgi:hypothetical protein
MTAHQPHRETEKGVRVKLIWGIALGLATVALLAGCGGSDNSSAGNGSSKTSASSTPSPTSATKSPAAAVKASGPQNCSAYVGHVATATRGSCRQHGLLYPIQVTKCQNGHAYVSYGSLVGGVVGKKVVARKTPGILDGTHCKMS